MYVYRVERRKYLETTLRGVGAALTEGFRWNSMNTFMVYTAESRALAMLEVSVHLDLSADLPNDRYFVKIEIPDDLKIMELKYEELPEKWNSIPPTQETQFIGDDFVFEGKAAVLKVPSSIVPPEFNYLINPHHSDAKKIRVTSVQPFKFDNKLKSFGESSN